MLARPLFASLALVSSLHADTFVAMPEAYLPANPANGAAVTWNPGQPNEVTGLVFGTDAFTDVQPAIDAAAAGDTVFIDEGDYTKGSTTSIQKNLTLTGGNRETTRLLREETADPHSVVSIGNHTVVLENLTVSGGQSPEDRETGGGIRCLRSTLTLRNCLITNNTSDAQKAGGGIGAIDSNLTVIDSTISNNRCSTGVDNGGGIGGRRSTIVATNSIISNNVVTSSTSGGGIGGNAQTVTVKQSVIRDNTSTSGGSGGGVGGFRMRFTANDSTILNNQARGANSGGGLGGRESRITVTGSVISGNTARQSNSGGAVGGAVNTIRVSHSTITGNTSEGSRSGGGIGGNQPNITVSNSTVSGNTATGIESGGGISGQNPRITAINTTITDNTATGGASGGGIRAFSVNFISLTNTILAGNSVTRGNSRRELFGTLTDEGGNVVGIPDGLTIGDIVLPLADNGGPTQTHALAENSPAINIGLNNALGDISTDQRGDGFPRVLNNLIDAGAVEADTNIALDPTDDSDADGLSLGLELAIGTEPNAPDFGAAQFLSQAFQENGQLTHQFGRGLHPLPGTTLVLQRSTSLAEGSFRDVFALDLDASVSILDEGFSASSEERPGFIDLIETNLAERAFYRIGVRFVDLDG